MRPVHYLACFLWGLACELFLYILLISMGMSCGILNNIFLNVGL